MSTALGAVLFLVAWLAVLAGLGWWAQRDIRGRDHYKSKQKRASAGGSK